MPARHSGTTPAIELLRPAGRHRIRGAAFEKVPDGGEDFTVTEPQASVAVIDQNTEVLQLGTTMFDGQMIVGGVVS